MHGRVVGLHCKWGNCTVAEIQRRQVFIYPDEQRGHTMVRMRLMHRKIRTAA